MWQRDADSATDARSMESKANDVAPIKIPENYLNSQTEEDIGAFADPKEGVQR